MTPIDRNRLAVVPWMGLTIALVAVVLLGWRWWEARREVAALHVWQGAVMRQISTATGAKAVLTPADATEALAGIVAARDGAAAMARTLPATDVDPAEMAGSAIPVPPPVPSNDTSGEISRLRQTQSTGTAAGDAHIIDQDSQAAWTGWK